MPPRARCVTPIVVRAGAELVEHQLRIAVGPAREVEKLHDEQLPAGEARMLHGGRRMADHGADLHSIPI